MQPFNVSEPATRFTEYYPESEILKSLGLAISPIERECFIRLWLSEGIPRAFGKLPMLYEIVRGWIGKQLLIDPKNITLVGSARLGYSLKPGNIFGKYFGAHSDLDLAIISENLFSQLSDDFNHWRHDYESNLIAPRNDKEKGYWQDNLRRLPGNITKGFIDIHKIPLLWKYKATLRLGQICSNLMQKLFVTAKSPKVKKISIRIYRDWKAFIDQTHLNLISALYSLRES